MLTVPGGFFFLKLDRGNEGKAIARTTSDTGDGLYPAGRYPRALVIGMAADRAISASDVTYMTIKNYASVEYLTRRVSGILSRVVSM